MVNSTDVIPRADRWQLRAAAIQRIRDKVCDLERLDDVFLVVIERALDHDMPGVQQFSRCTGEILHPELSAKNGSVIS